MPYFVRKITRAKWPDESITDNPFDIPADAITVDLKTSTNKLSVWEVTDEGEIGDAVLAIASGFDRIDRFDVVWIDITEIDRRGIKFIKSPGLTPVESLKNTHIDLSSLNYYYVGLFAESIIDTIRSEKIKRYSKGEIKKLLLTAIQEGKLNMDDLAEKIREELQK